MNCSGSLDKETILINAEAYIKNKGLSIFSRDAERPWGGYFVIEESHAEKFIAAFFPQLTLKELSVSGRLSPKILIVGPKKRLSWQYHHRRAEIWTLIEGQAAVIKSDTDEENETVILQKGNISELRQGERHRLIGLQNWGMVAEIWRHTNPEHPSNEDDIIRVQDDFGR